MVLKSSRIDSITLEQRPFLHLRSLMVWRCASLDFMFKNRVVTVKNHARRVYIAYLDSVHFFQPRDHLDLHIAYFKLHKSSVFA
ncbi:hypothetical protein OSTOST_13234, partial [Ostertagia ostertagi]